jgi:hypothetical protein
VIDDIEVLREVWRVTERRNGAVYKAVYVEDRWMSPLDLRLGDDLFTTPKSTSYDGPTIRRKR